MKIAHKVGIAAATVLFLTTSLLSLSQVSQVRDTLRSQVESSNALARQIENWLNAKLRLIDLMSQTIDSSYSPEENQRVFDAPLCAGSGRQANQEQRRLETQRRLGRP
ncbi:hypothetical protein [Ectopseudomonas oleovorans]|uniref:hypothetical protein n=1 Tax=Ectopseudomonas oleovorans TaxID=301 RepID=UPI0021ADC989|nr:hypothetical protein [Pseudomonas oleovorans]